MVEKFQKYALIVQLFSTVLIGCRLVLLISYWFLPQLYAVMHGTVAEYDATLFSLAQKLSGFLVEALQAGLLIYGLLLVIQLMQGFKAKRYFTVDTILTLKKITKTALGYLLYAFFSQGALSVITSWHNAPGQRRLALSFGTDDMINIMIFCSLFLILTIFQRGYELKHEQDLTI